MNQKKIITMKQQQETKQQRQEHNRRQQELAVFKKRLKEIVSKETQMVLFEDGSHQLVFPPSLAREGYRLIIEGLIEKEMQEAKKTLDNDQPFEYKTIKAELMARVKGRFFQIAEASLANYEKMYFPQEAQEGETQKEESHEQQQDQTREHDLTRPEELPPTV